MKILSIETSCDDTSITLMEAKKLANGASFKILADASDSQIKIHAEYGGVFPAMAKKEHIKNLPILFKKIENKLKNKIDAVTVTYGPGLEPSLWTGIVFAKELAEKYKIPLIPVNHMEGHIISPFAKDKGNFKVILKKDMFPILSLLVSGGHTEIILMKDFGKYEIIGKTLDDAAGEAYDKVGRMLDLKYPGGPKISMLAEEMRKEKRQGKIKLPRPMIYSKNFDFSFSGLKTAVLYMIRDMGDLNEGMKKEIALEFENSVVETIIYKLVKAQDKYKAKTILIGGGVACNKHLQREIKRIFKKRVKVLFPTKKLSGDNSIMIGMVGFLQYIKNNKKVPKMSSIKATGNLSLGS